VRFVFEDVTSPSAIGGGIDQSNFARSICSQRLTPFRSHQLSTTISELFSFSFEQNIGPDKRQSQGWQDDDYGKYPEHKALEHHRTLPLQTSAREMP
jgi:hypothetical protein